MTSGIATNIDELKDALLVYQNVVRTGASKALYNKMGDLAFTAAENTKFSSPEAIRKSISSLPIKNDGGIKRYGDTQYVGQYKLINWLRKLNNLGTLGGGKYRKVNTTKPNSLVYTEKRVRLGSRLAGLGVRGNIYSMEGKYKKLLQARARSSKFLRAGWAVAASFYGKPFNRGDFGPATIARLSGKGYGGGEIKKLNPDLTEFSMFNGAGQYDVRGKSPVVRRSSDQRRARAIIEDALKKAIDVVLNDPRRGIIPYLAERYERSQKAIKVLGSKLRVI
jgi:hypothetical protein